jgi:arsenate reductase-like glutaredoxin family protein
MAPTAATPAAAPRIQIFGLEKDRATRAAIRFFKERRAEVDLVDLRRKPISPGELRRFVQRLGAEALLETAGRTYREAGLSYLTLDEQGIVARILADQRLLRLPLVRFGEAVTAGPADATWKAWLTPDRATRPT